MENIIYKNGKSYRKLERHEIIKEGAMHSWKGQELRPIFHHDTIGQTPSDFSNDRDFYNPIDLAEKTHRLSFEREMEPQNHIFGKKFCGFNSIRYYQFVYQPFWLKDSKNQYEMFYYFGPSHKRIVKTLWKTEI